MAMIHFSESTFDKEVLASKLPVLVDFSADWCGPCRMAAPIIEELAGIYEGKILIGKLDVDANVGIAARYGVQSIPTVIMFEGGKEVDRKVGFGGRSGYEEMIKKVIS